MQDLKLLDDNELKELYDEFLEEVYGMVDVCGYQYSAARAFKEVDPTAYRCGFNDWLDNMIEDETILEIDGEYYCK